MRSNIQPRQLSDILFFYNVFFFTSSYTILSPSSNTIQGSSWTLVRPQMLKVRFISEEILNIFHRSLHNWIWIWKYLRGGGGDSVHAKCILHIFFLYFSNCFFEISEFFWLSLVAIFNCCIWASASVFARHSGFGFLTHTQTRSLVMCHLWIWMGLHFPGLS